MSYQVECDDYRAPKVYKDRTEAERRAERLNAEAPCTLPHRVVES